MEANRGFLGGFFDNAEILFFILVFLILFCNRNEPIFDNKIC